MLKQRAFYSVVLLVLTSVLLGCGKSTTFAGFTFGGGGHTFSAEPAVLTQSGSGGKLVAGSPSQATYLLLEWEAQSMVFDRKPISLNKVEVKVDSQGRSDRLVEGHIVLQASEDKIGHGSFQCTVKLEDGREFPIVGSFTANL